MSAGGEFPLTCQNHPSPNKAMHITESRGLVRTIHQHPDDSPSEGDVYIIRTPETVPSGDEYWCEVRWVVLQELWFPHFEGFEIVEKIGTGWYHCSPADLEEPTDLRDLQVSFKEGLDCTQLQERLLTIRAGVPDQVIWGDVLRQSFYCGQLGGKAFNRVNRRMRYDRRCLPGGYTAIHWLLEGFEDRLNALHRRIGLQREYDIDLEVWVEFVREEIAAERQWVPKLV